MAVLSWFLFLTFRTNICIKFVFIFDCNISGFINGLTLFENIRECRANSMRHGFIDIKMTSFLCELCYSNVFFFFHFIFPSFIKCDTMNKIEIYVFESHIHIVLMNYWNEVAKCDKLNGWEFVHTKCLFTTRWKWLICLVIKIISMTKSCGLWASTRYFQPVLQSMVWMK